MKVRISELDCASRAALSALDTNAVGDIARAEAGCGLEDAEISLYDAGRAVAASLVWSALLGSGTPGHSVVLAAGLNLASVRIDGAADEPVFLAPSAVAAHPMFGPWIAQDFIGVIAEMLKAGVAWTLLSGDAPLMEEIQITDFGGAVIGVHVRFVWLRQGEPLTVTASYGAAGATAALRRVLAICAPTVIEIGYRLPLVDGLQRADEAAANGAVKAAAEAAGAAIH